MQINFNVLDPHLVRFDACMYVGMLCQLVLFVEAFTASITDVVFWTIMQTDVLPKFRFIRENLQRVRGWYKMMIHDNKAVYTKTRVAVLSLTAEKTSSTNQQLQKLRIRASTLGRQNKAVHTTASVAYVGQGQ